MMRMISYGIPYKRRMCHKLSLWMLLNAFSKSKKLIYSCLCHSVHCSMMLRRVIIWSAHSLPFLNPACSLLSCLSIESKIMFLLVFRLELTTVPVVTVFREPFFGIFKIRNFDQSFCILFPFHMDVKSLRSQQPVSLISVGCRPPRFVTNPVILMDRISRCSRAVGMGCSTVVWASHHCFLQMIWSC